MRDAIASRVGQVFSAAPGVSRHRRDVQHTWLGCGTVWKAGGGKFSFPSHKTAEIFRIPDLLIAVTMIL